MLRSSLLKLTLLFEEYSSDEHMGVEHEASRSWSGVGFLVNAKEEEGRPSFLGNSGEENFESNKNDSCWDNSGSVGESN